MVGHQPDTIDRQNKLAQWIVDLVNKEGLGDANLRSFRHLQRDKKGNVKEVTRHNVHICVHGKHGGSTKEKIVWYGHFDVVEPSDEYESTGRKPDQLVRDEENEDFWKGLGSYDMLSGITAIIRALKDLNVHGDRDIEIILCCDEEDISRGVHEAFDSNLFQGVHGAITTEILVNTDLLRKDRALIIGRPGRFSLYGTCRGLEKHMGAVTDEDRRKLTINLFTDAVREIQQVALSSHPDDPEQLVMRARCEIPSWESNGKASLTTPASGKFTVNVHYYDRHQGPDQVVTIVRDRLRSIAESVFADQVDRDKAYSIDPEQRDTPHTPPWKESVSEPLIRKMRALMNDENIARGGRADGIQDIVDTGTADCPVKRFRGNFPIAGVPTKGGAPHKPEEFVLGSSIDYVEGVLRRSAAYEGSLTEN